MWTTYLKRERAEAMAAAIKKAYGDPQKADAKLIELVTILEVADTIKIK